MLNLFETAITVLLLISLSCGNQKATTKEITVQLKEVNADSLGIIDPSFSSARAIKGENFLEEILAFPADFQVKNIYQFHVQNLLKISKAFKEDSVSKAEIEKSAPLSTRTFLEKLYSAPGVDDIVSACWVENNTGQDFFVFDANNDEDLSNDRLLEFKAFPGGFAPERSEKFFLAENEVTIEIFNGQQIKEHTMLLGFFKFQDSAGGTRGFFSNRRLKMAQLTLDGETFDCILFQLLPDVNYQSTDILWIDLNHDHKYQFKEDFYQQMYQPFTLKKKTYRLKQLDVFGRYLTLEIPDPQEVPPIAVGLPCPNFEVTFIDSTKFSTAQTKGQYLVLDFWMCSDQYCDMMSKDLLNKIQNKEHVFWLSCPLGAQSYERLKKIEIISGKDPRHFVAPQDIEPLRKLFQVRTEKILFVIDPQGEIKSIEKFTQKQTEQILRQISETD